jgi:hypothetical protein
MPDMQNPNGLAHFIYFVENPIGVFAPAKEKASDLTSRFLRFTG